VDGPGPLRAIPADNPLYARDDWQLVRKKLRAIAFKRIDKQSMPRAEDLAHASILKCLEHTSEPWKLSHKKLVGWLAGVVGRIVFNEARHAESFPEVPTAGEARKVELDDGTSYTAGAILHARGPSPEEAALTAEAEAIYRGRLDRLAARVADDALALLLVSEVRKVDGSPQEAALARGFTADDVYNGRKRLERAAHAVLDEEQRAAPKPGEEARP
jgi:hypothetical protein